MYLIIGGTKFLGRHLADSLLARGHEVVLFNRGKLAASGMPDVEIVHGDRNRDLGKLKGRKWEAVIDTCGYLPQSVRDSAQALAGSAELYIFISSVSAYAGFDTPDFDETAPLAELTLPQQRKAKRVDPSGEINALMLGDLYGGLKAQCERATEIAMPGRVLIIRPGLITGPFDWTDRFTYWVMRTAEGGEVLAPGDPDRFIQMIDARDLADWTVKMAENRSAGIYNATGKPFHLTMGQMLEHIRTATGSNATFTWAPEDFLARENVRPWGEMPLYLPESDDDSRGFLSVNIDRALSKGLNFRPLAETVRDTLDWRQELDGPLKAGISRERETELLAKLRSR